MNDIVNNVSNFDAILSRAPLRRVGPVMDYVGERAFQLPTGNDAAVAAVLVEARPKLDRAFERLRDGNADGPGELHRALYHGRPLVGQPLRVCGTGHQ